MKSSNLKNYTPVDQSRLVLPILVGDVLLLGGTLLTQYQPGSKFSYHEMLLLSMWLAGLVYAILLFRILLYLPRLFDRLRWINTGIVSIGVILVQSIFPEVGVLYFGVFLFLSVALNAMLSGRSHAMFTFFTVAGFSALLMITLGLTSLADWTHFVPITLAALVLTITILRLQNSTQEHIQRLEIVNEFARQGASSLDTGHVLAALDTAVKQSLNPDTYFAGVLEEDMIHLLLFYDDGEYYSSAELKMEGTLSSWVIRNQKTLFVPDLREEPQLEGVRMVQIGKARLNQCWLGVPMKTARLTGILAVASYQPNTFDRNDVELMENLAQHTAQTLGNTFQHARVEEQTYLDSLTGVYNHGHFLKVLNGQTQQALQTRETLSLVMMDIDHFKQYNDLYGHLAGDDILTSLCNIIRRHIKRTDAVGRWGGEEFVISLPGAGGSQALNVCRRIQETMRQVNIQTLDGSVIPVPSLSLGVATFPGEARDVMGLVHLADKRLYVAKERGRNQIEPGEEYWESIQAGEETEQQGPSARPA